VLSDSELLKRLLHPDPTERIVISPLIHAPEQIGPSSIDVHLGTDFLVVERSDRVEFDPLMNDEEYKEWLKHVKSTSRYSVLESFILHPGEFALSTTLEFIGLPATIVGHIDGRSSWARQGLKVHSTAGNIHPGSRGFVVFELENVGPVPIVLYPGLAIAQLTFDNMEGKVLENYSDRKQSRYSGIIDMLWSAYPEDTVLTSMRALKERETRKYQVSLIPIDKRDQHYDRFVSAAGAATSDEPLHFDPDETLDAIADALQSLDKGDLQNLADPVLALTGDDIIDFLARTEDRMREFLNRRCETLYEDDPYRLELVRKVLMTFVRQKVRQRR
jgi:dCTP deaminase